ncbi:MAG: nuclear transport factor 2 family protein [Flavobacteriaceae bacterium]|nr:nuclear transport factor 2 family protein [Bacteroidia bacterium]NNL60821.1 nuclear transport factor 2 family protein [Flavobacteriaceae bacterium]
MKSSKTIKTIALVLSIALAQVTKAQDYASRYNETITANPTANIDLKAMNDYANAVVYNDMKKAESLLADTYVNHGPAAKESQTKEETIAAWKETHKVRSNQKVDFVMTTFKVVEESNPFKGKWVSQWGTYTFTENGKDFDLPYQFTARMADGKIQESYFYYDRLSLLVGMGYTFSEPKKE